MASADPQGRPDNSELCSECQYSGSEGDVGENRPEGEVDNIAPAPVMVRRRRGRPIGSRTRISGILVGRRRRSSSRRRRRGRRQRRRRRHRRHPINPDDE